MLSHNRSVAATYTILPLPTALPKSRVVNGIAIPALPALNMFAEPSIQALDHN